MNWNSLKAADMPRHTGEESKLAAKILAEGV